jgi:hypothetical protein
MNFARVNVTEWTSQSRVALRWQCGGNAAVMRRCCACGRRLFRLNDYRVSTSMLAASLCAWPVPSRWYGSTRRASGLRRRASRPVEYSR